MKATNFGCLFSLHLYMLKNILISILFFISSLSFAQVDSTYVTNNYLEDQIYLRVTYNTLNKRPSQFRQNGLSGTVSLGFIKDIPLNENRNVGIAIGLGYAYNVYIQNLKISKVANATLFETVASDNFKSNRLLTHTVEVPIEFRWRTSTPTKYKFWRIYSGIKVGYVFANSSKYMDDLTKIKVRNIEELQKLQYGLTLSAGYNTLNVHFYYGLNSLFKNATVNGESIDIKQFNVGLIFYIL